MSGTLRIGDIEVHPAANLFPEMGEDDLDALYESVKAGGVRVPLVFFDGKLIDGRNRLRASVMAGMDTAKLPRRTLPAETDPYQWAWDLNCSRLDYSPAQKAAIRIKIDEESGKLGEARLERFRAANAARAAKAKEHPRDESGDFKPSGRVSSDTPPPDRHRERERIAKEAKVSPATVARVQKLKREDPAAFEHLAAHGERPRSNGKRSAAKNWSVPRDITMLSVFLRERLTSHDRLKLARLLAE